VSGAAGSGGGSTGGASLLENSPAALFVLDLKGTVLAHNRTMAQWFAAGEEALHGRNIVEWLTPASRLLYETQVMPRLLETGRLREVILEIVKGDGNRHAAMISAQLRSAEDGARVAYIAALETTERAAFEKQLVDARRAADIAHRRLVLLQDATSALAVAKGLDDLGETLVTAAGRAMTAAWTAVRLADPSDRLPAAPHQWGATPPGVELEGRIHADSAQLVCRNMAEILAAVPQDAAALRAAGVEAMTVTPITRTHDGITTILGEIRCWFRRARTLDADELETVAAVAAQAERVVDHLRLQDRLRHHALHDGLTGLPNRTLFEERLDALLVQAARDRTTCAVLFLDLDGFKAINDRLGHGVGDEVLRTVATRLSGVCRAEDTVARLGGDEFLIAACGLDHRAAADLAERVRAAVAAPLTGEAAGSPLSASVGVLLKHPEHGPSGDGGSDAADLVAAADAAMYEAKRDGKDGVRIHTIGSPGTPGR
jgi:diguanylate cyclase (GGDEF)-like protein/PAS domain S-box-containing protein